MMAALTEEQREMILEIAEDGELSKAEIARRAGVSRPTVYKVLREEGLLNDVSGGEAEEEIYGEGDEAPDAVGYGEEEEGEETEDDAYADEDEDEDGEEDDEEDEDEGLEELPASVVLGSPSSALGGLVVGAILGALGLYYAMMRGLIGPPRPGRAGG